MKITSEGGCVDSLVRFGYVEVDRGGAIFVPNSFSPFNNDNLNKTFKPTFVGISENEYSFQIYTRWGQKVFETSNINEGWDGTFGGKRVELESYIYTVQGRYVSGNSFSEKGVINLLD